jgi:serine protease Do
MESTVRKSLFGIGVVLIAALAGVADEPPSIADARKVETAIQAAIAKAEPAVACVLVYRESDPSSAPARPKIPPDEANRVPVPDSYGSGVVISSQGLVLTNYHVVRGTGTIQVRLPGIRDENGVEGPARGGSATIIAADNRSDLAVLKLWTPAPPYPALKLGRGEDLRKGSFVISLAHPYAAGYRDGSASASWGIVSNLRRLPGNADNEFERASKALCQLGTLIQTDVRLQLGTSGGALLDMDGSLVGLTTAQAALTGVDAPGGFAMPLDANMRRIVDVLLRGEEVEYGFLGVNLNLDYPLNSGGVRLRDVFPNTPANSAGLQRSDVILKVNGQPIRDADDLFLHLATTLAGRRAELLVRRGNREFTADAKLVKAPVNVPDKIEGVVRQSDGRLKVVRFDGKDGGVAKNRPAAIYGLRIDYSSVISHGGAIAEGVVVREVEPNSSAQKAGLQEYVDRITHVNGELIFAPADFYRLTQRPAAAGEKITLTIPGPPGEGSRTVTLP